MDTNTAFGSRAAFKPSGIVQSQNNSLLMSSSSSFGIATPMFGHSSGTSAGRNSGQPTVFGQSTFSLNTAGQAPLFGQNAGTTTVTSAGQSSVFGQPFGKCGVPFGAQSSLFGQSGESSFADVSGQALLFGQAAGAPSVKNTGKTPLFGQSNAANVTPTGQAPLFGQNIGTTSAASTVSQVSVFGQSAGTSSGSSSGQTSVFGQAVGTAAAATNNQTSLSVFGFGSGMPAGDSAGKGSVFGQNTSIFTTSSSGQSSLFGQSTGLSVVSSAGKTHAFGQTSGITRGSSSGQTPIFGNCGMSSVTSGNRVSVFGQSSSSSLNSTGSVPLFGQSTERSAVPGNGQVSVFGQGVMTPAVSTTGQLSESTQAFSGQPIGFGQPSAFSPATGSSHTSAFGQLLGKSAAVTVVEKQGFSSKATLGTSSEEGTGSASGKSGFGFKPIFSADTKTQITPSDFSFSHPGTSGAGGPGLSGKLPEAPSTNSSSASFSFSQQGTNADSSFSFEFPRKTSSEEEKADAPVFGSTPNFGKSSVGFSQSGKISDDAKVGKSQMGSLSSGITKGVKRKEEGLHTPKRTETHSMEKSELESLSDLSSGKRQMKLSLPLVGGNLFSRALRDVFKSSDRDRSRSSSRESMRDDERGRSSSTQSRRENLPPLELERTPRTSSVHPGQSGSLAVKENPRSRQITDSDNKPSRRSLRNERSGSFSGSSTRELTAIQCKNIPVRLNKKDLIKKHFSAYGKVQRVFCNPRKNMAVVHFHDHAAAENAKKHGTVYRMAQLQIFWQKKRSPGKKEHSVEEESRKAAENLERCNNDSFQHSPLRKPLSGSPSVRNTTLSQSKGTSLKSSATKMLQFDADTQESSSEGQVSECSASSLPSSLSSLVGLTAESSYHKYRILEQRDKIMRQAALVKRTELDKAKALVGTCPDMCPEKERYMREIQNQISVFETIPGTNEVDHGAAVKEYSRSSADQEEPLPHELRPLPVLVMTMNYLVTKVMNSGFGKREWYDFVWNRTRGIRKDVTQQHLCDLETVSLIEKCTRFHIHCAHYMCEEPLSSFDAKINNENLTKCLQTLKEMYHDLSKKGVHCPSEAEFRCYSILLSLDQGVILREAQLFRPAIRNSQEVKFAIQTFAAFNSNNFVRFFKLTRSATYLNACILHRYFNLVRVLGLKILTTAFTVSTQRSVTFPIGSVVNMLLFLNDAEAIDFLNLYGLTTSEGFVELNRQVLQEPENHFLLKKSVLIEQKCSVSAGEVVNGGPLPLVPIHVPFSSFNNANKYKGESAITEPASTSQRFSFGMSAPPLVGQQEKKEQIPETSVAPTKLQPSALAQESVQYLFRPIKPSEPSTEPQPKTPPPYYTDEDIFSIAETLVEEVVEVNCKTVAKAGAEYANTALSVSERAVEQAVADVTLEVLQNVCGEEFSAEQARVKEEKRKAEEEKCRVEEEKRRIEEARRRREALEQFISSFSQVVCSELTEEVSSESFQDIAETELLCAFEKDKADRIARCSEVICSNLLELNLDEEIFQIARGTVKQLRCCAKYLQRWREVVAARKKLRRQMRAFPAGPCGVDPLHKLKALLPSARFPEVMADSTRGVLHLEHAGTLAVSCTQLLQMREETSYKMRIHNFLQQLLCEASWTPLNVPSLVAENLPFPREHIFWKLILMVPDSEDTPGFEEINSVLADWLQAKFRENELSGDVASSTKDQIQTLSLYSSYRHTKGQFVNLHICIKVTQGTFCAEDLESVEVRKELLGTSALMFLLPVQSKATDSDGKAIYWLSAILQLKQILQAKPFHPAVPLVVLVLQLEQEPLSEEDVRNGMMLQDLVAASLISEYLIVQIPCSAANLQGATKVSEALKWLASCCPYLPELCSQTFLQFLEDGVCKEFSDRFCRDKMERQAACLPSQCPAAIVELYNSVISFFSKVVSSEELCDLSWPVMEFSRCGASSLLPNLQWNTSEYVDWLQEAVLAFHIPEVNLPPLHAPWSSVCAAVKHYASLIPTSSHTLYVLLSQVNNLLDRVYNEWQDSNLEFLGGDGPNVQDIPWDDIIILCISHRLRDWKPPELPGISAALDDDGQIMVCYFKHDLKNYQPPHSWKEARLRTQKEAEHVPTSMCWKSKSPVKRRSLRVQTSQMPHNNSLAVQMSANFTKMDITQKVPEDQLLVRRLSSRLKVEKEENQRFEDRLKRLLDEQPEDLTVSLSLPCYLPAALLHTSDAFQSMFRPPHSSESQIQSNVPCSTEVKPNKTVMSRLKELKRLLKANKEENLAYDLHLASILDINEA